MANSKFVELEYEYAFEEFIIGFAVVAVLVFYFLLNLRPSIPFAYIAIGTTFSGAVVGLIWTYIRAHLIFSASKRKR